MGQCLQLHSPHATHQVSWRSSPHLASGTANLTGPAEALRRSHTMSRPSPAVVSSWLSFTCEMPARGVSRAGAAGRDARLENETHWSGQQKLRTRNERQRAQRKLRPGCSPPHLTRDAALLRKLQGGAAGLLPHVEPDGRQAGHGIVAPLVQSGESVSKLGKLHQRWCELAAHSM